MALTIMRLDKREETRASEIVKDWRKWATDNGYIKNVSLLVEQGNMSITLETWEHPSATEDTYLFYHPEIPTTTDTEVLYILNNKDQLERMSGISKHLASDLMRRIQLHADVTKGNDWMKGKGNSQQAQWN
jgi:hypothetical protein